MSNQIFIQQTFDGPVDIVGDIHGEIDALQQLLEVLGYDLQGRHPEQRKLIFVGDLCDRGPDSIAVIRQVKTLIENGNAQCILGNHEINLLTDTLREGNGWFFGSPHQDDLKTFDSVQASIQDRAWILEFLNSLPLALDAPHLRIVHACWDTQAIQQLKSVPFNSIRQAYDYFVLKNELELQTLGFDEYIQSEQQQYQGQFKDPAASIPLLKYIAEKELRDQMQNPIRTLSSGAEKIAQRPVYAGGRWRMIDRLPWWERYTDRIPVVIGHYWRNFKTTEEKSGLFKHIDALQWFGQQQNVFCVDYSVGRRYRDRQQQAEFAHHLGALRLPENLVIFEDGQQYFTQKMT